MSNGVARCSFIALALIGLTLFASENAHAETKYWIFCDCDITHEGIDKLTTQPQRI